MQQPTEPNFVKNITAIQRIFSGMAVSMFLMVYITGYDFIKDIFKPDFVVFLTYLRVGMAIMAILMTAFVGYNQILKMLTWIIENYETYKQITEIRKNKKD